tara:strand:- start:38276 stop:40816 length:2541 start_codon:yes stop_codon:yes gene_type:complete
MRQLSVFCAGMLFCISNVLAQLPKKHSSADIFHSVQKLNFLGTALYIAAHPDDENTRLISFLSNETKARTAYLSLTRGDGGQNLIGPELRELLGVLRTQELLAARRVDGGEQYFTRANDFGFSKHPDETLEIWDKQAVLGDVVWVIRNLRPDVIINRFDHRSPGTTHGHHTSSAILSLEAFDIANDQKAYPSQLENVRPWQPKRVFFNTSWWFYGSEAKFEEADKSKMLSVDVGVYYPLKGISNNEIASLASSQHLCQGFGRISDRGSEKEYIELLKGDMPEDRSNIFDGIDTSWSRIPEGKAIGDILYGVEKNFNFKDPSVHVSELLKAYKLLQKNPDDHWRTIKTKELEAIITAVSGLYLEATTDTGSASPGSALKIQIEALNRSGANVSLLKVEIAPTGTRKEVVTELLPNKKTTFTMDLVVPQNTAYTSPYWLNEQGTLGTYKVTDPMLIGKPETPKAFTVNFDLEMEGVPIRLSRSVVHHYAKPDKGEIQEPFEILPPVTTFLENKVLLFAESGAKRIPVKIKAGKQQVSGSLSLKVPSDWQVSPAEIPFNIAQKGDGTTVYFTITPPEGESEGELTAVAVVEGIKYDQELVEINYDHIPKQSVLLPSKAKIVRLDIRRAGENIGYIMGAGDEVPKSLLQIGYKVDYIDPIKIQEGSLSKFDAIVVGIRAYNVVDELRFKQKFLLDYVKDGGNLIVQYNTAGRNGLEFENLAPYPLRVSRDRVTDENSPITILASDHDLVNYPNKIAEADFKGWVQERGLYFPDQWGGEFTPILSMHDKGESPSQGSLLAASYGKGHYIYTGLSFFRELPEGVSGAYKLFANMLSLGASDQNQESPIKKRP